MRPRGCSLRRPRQRQRRANATERERLCVVGGEEEEGGLNEISSVGLGLVAAATEPRAEHSRGGTNSETIEMGV